MENETVLKGSKTNIFEFIIKKCLFLLVFLIPIFWSPFALSSYEIGKHQLLVLLSSIAFLTWTAKVILQDKKVSLNLNLLDLSVLLFLFFGSLSTIFSLDNYISLFGSYANFSNGLVGMLALGVVYFLVRTGEGAFSVEKLLKIFFLSFGVVLLIAYFSVLGIGNKFPLENIAIQQRIFNSVSFSLEGLSVFVSITMVLLTGVIACSIIKEKDRFLKALLFAGLFLLVLINTNPAWIVLLSGSFIFTFIALLSGSFKRDIHQLLLPIFLVIVASLFLLIDLGYNEFLDFPREDYLGQSFSYEIAGSAVQEGPKEILIGSGLGTWENSFLKYRSVEFNEESLLWNSRLKRAGNHISELLATGGVLVLSSYLLLIGFSLYGFFSLKEKRMAIPYISTLIAVAVSHFVYYQNTSLAFLAWFILGLGAVTWKDPLSRKFSLRADLSAERMPELNLGFSVLLILLGLSTLTILFFTTKEAIADYYYYQSHKEEDFDRAISFLERALEQNPYRIEYITILSESYLYQAIEEYGKPAEEQDIMFIQGKIGTIENYMEILESRFKNNVRAWETIALLKTEIYGSLEGALEALERSLELDRNNPVTHVEIGRIYLSMENFEKARESYAKAREVKPNYFYAYLLDALSYAEEEEIDLAIEKLREVEMKFPNVAEAKFHLGRLYREAGKNDLAIMSFIETIQLVPDHSDSLYSLGLIYEEEGNKEVALAAFERVLELNPENELVLEKIEELRGETEK